MTIHPAHSPLHLLEKDGTYIVTAGTYQKVHYFHTPERKNLLLNTLFDLASFHHWDLQAWAVLNNHYHFVAVCKNNPQSLRELLNDLHRETATVINRMDNCAGRKVWYQYWESHIDYQKSDLARLNYVQQNPVHHKLVVEAEDYPWCSAAWFAKRANSSFYNTVKSFKIDKVNVFDEF